MFRAPPFWIAWFLMLCGLCAWASAQAPAPGVPPSRGVVKIARVVGEAYVTDSATSLKTRLTASTLVVDGQVVETGPKSSLVLVFSNGAVVNVRADSRLEVAEFRQSAFSKTLNVGQSTQEPSTSATKLLLRKGEIISQVKKLNRDAGSSFTVETPVGAAGIRGTAFGLLFEGRGQVAKYALTMAEGLIRFTPLSGRPVDVGAGKELSFDAQIDPSNGRVVAVPETPAPTDVPAADAARLQSALTEVIAAASSVQFVPATGANGQFTVSAADASTTPSADAAGTGSVDTATASPSDTSSTSTGALASPAPTPAAQRTTPGDGM
ncbi:hypothetical protein DB347_08685 [Opitutaceae bacterium EW11]|nr:hypothetical protein DB347_08685 [Opitutaceae bacterium EW11]